jgi:hypothetical protein
MDKELDDLKKVYSLDKHGLSNDFTFSKANSVNELGKLKKEQLKMVFTFLFTASIIVYVDYVSSQKMETSRPGFYILLGCAIYYAATKFFLFQKLGSIDASLPVLKCIAQVEAYKKLNQFFYTYGELLYVIILSFGVYLYLQPILIHLSGLNPTKYLEFLKFIWIAYLGWAVFNTFYLKRKCLKKETNILETYLRQLSSDPSEIK